jgi:hypothetical protein
MTSTKPITVSEHYARVVLSAWEQRELTELEPALTQLLITLPENSAVETERMDLIRDLGRTLLIAENGTNQGTTLTLLRHLARLG